MCFWGWGGAGGVGDQIVGSAGSVGSTIKLAPQSACLISIWERIKKALV